MHAPSLPRSLRCHLHVDTLRPEAHRDTLIEAAAEPEVRLDRFLGALLIAPGQDPRRGLDACPQRLPPRVAGRDQDPVVGPDPPDLPDPLFAAEVEHSLGDPEPDRRRDRLSGAAVGHDEAVLVAAELLEVVPAPRLELVGGGVADAAEEPVPAVGDAFAHAHTNSSRFARCAKRQIATLARSALIPASPRDVWPASRRASCGPSAAR